jgi:hypothetical protein
MVMPPDPQPSTPLIDPPAATAATIFFGLLRGRNEFGWSIALCPIIVAFQQHIAALILSRTFGRASTTSNLYERGKS